MKAGISSLFLYKLCFIFIAALNEERKRLGVKFANLEKVVLEDSFLLKSTETHQI